MESLDYLYLVPFELFAGCRLYPSGSVSVFPSWGCGYVFSVISYDPVAYRHDGEYEYSRKIFYNPVVSFRIEISVLLFSGCRLSGETGYCMVLEKGRVGTVPVFGIGISFII